MTTTLGPDHWREVARVAVGRHGALQKPEELAALLALAAATLRPGQVVLEIGCWVGGTLWAWSQLPGPPRVVGVTLPAKHPGMDRDPDYHGAQMVFGDSHAEATRREVEALIPGRRVGLLHIDGDHRYPAVMRDFFTYRELTPHGGLVALHDIRGHTDNLTEVDVFWAGLQALKLEILAPPYHHQGFGVVIC